MSAGDFTMPVRHDEDMMSYWRINPGDPVTTRKQQPMKLQAKGEGSILMSKFRVVV